MKSVTTFHLCASRKAKCDQLIESGVFDTMSGLIDSALRLFLIDSCRGRVPTYVWREPPYVRVSVRANDWVRNRIVEQKIGTDADMADRAVDHLLHVLDLMEKKPDEE